MSNKLMQLLLVGIAALGCAANLAAKPEAVENGAYTTKDKEYYLSPEHLSFIRPGLELEIIGVSIPADRQTEVEFRLSDPSGLGLDRGGVSTPGPVSTSFILSYIPANEESYVAYTTRVQTSPITSESAEQASTDSGGSYTDLGDGRYMYKFATVLPETYDVDATHSMGMYARRDLTEFELDRYVSNELEHFVPSGASAPQPRSIVTTETCNGRCHAPLAIHGGSRQKVELCVLCHNANQDIDPDTGNSIDFPLMVHKIHAGAQLENGYTIIGYRQGVHDYSHVEYPAPVNECEACHTGGTPTENFPLVANPDPALSCDGKKFNTSELSWDYLNKFDIHVNAVDGPKFVGNASGMGSKQANWIQDGTTFFLLDKTTGTLVQELKLNTTVLGCLGNAPGAFVGVAGTQHTNWLDNPSRKNCGSCHDEVDFESGVGHSAFEIQQFNDDGCQDCHQPTSGPIPSIAIRAAHKEGYKSEQLPGVLVKIVEVTNTGPGQNPTVKFSLTTKTGQLDPAAMNRLRLSLSGPNEDFSFYEQESVGSAAVPDGKYWTYTFTTPLPANAEGSFSVGVEGRNSVTVEHNGEESTVSDQAENSIFAFAVTDTEAIPRRVVVDDAKCEACHSNLSLHGDNRKNTDYCVTCHMPGADDAAVRPAEELDPPQSINFKYMIHKIHRGAELENGYVVYGYRSSLHDFSHVEFPGDLRQCDSCHVNNSQQLPLPEGVLATSTPQELLDPMQPVAAACLSCHDKSSTAAHAATNTAAFGEACETCHGEGMEASVDKVHAQ